MKRIFSGLLTLIILLSLAGVGWGDTTIASYSESNQNWGQEMCSGGVEQAGQSFNLSGVVGDYNITKVTLYLYKTGSPTGNAVVKLYAADHTVAGEDAHPTGAALATSDTFDVSTLTGAYQLKDFTFSSTYKMVNGTDYCICLEYSGGDSSNKIYLGAQNGGSPTGLGNFFRYITGAWATYATADTCYYVYGTLADSPPTISTQAASSVTSSTATGNGTVDAANGTITEVGVCVGTSANPTVAGTHFTGTVVQSGAFTAAITDLSADTKYYVRAYAYNGAYGYGTDVTIGPPVLTSSAAVPVIASYCPMKATTATATASVSNENVALTEYGFVVKRWNTFGTNPGNPTTSSYDTKVVTGSSDHSGAFGSAGNLTGLNLLDSTYPRSGYQYNVRPYAINALGTAYGTTVVAPNVYYFSTTNDGGGTINSQADPYPFSALAGLAGSLKTMDSVLFKEGDQFLNNAFNAVTNIKYGSWGSGEKPLFWGADAEISSWTDLGNGVYSKNLGAGDNVYYVFVNGYNLGPSTRPELSQGAAGSITAGYHSVKVTWVDGTGETLPSPSSAARSFSGSQAASLTHVDVGCAGVTSRKIYMTTAGGSTYYLAATIANNTATTATVDIADAVLELQAEVPAADTSAGSYPIPVSPYFWHYTGTTLYYKPPTGQDTTHVRPYRTGGSYVFSDSGGVSNVDYSNLNIKGASPGLNHGASGVNPCNNILVSYCDASEGSSILVMANSTATSASSNIKVDNCTSTYSVANPIYFDHSGADCVDGLTITNNTLLYTNATRFGGFFTPQCIADADAIYIQNALNLLVANNEIGFGNTWGDTGIKVWVKNGGSYNGTIRNNYLHDLSCAGIFIENVNNNDYQIYNNIIYNTSLITSPVERYGTSTTPKLGAIYVTGDSPTSTAKLVSNNTIKGSDIGIITYGDYYNVKNNIVTDCTTYPAKNTSAQSNSSWSNNCYYAGTGSSTFYSINANKTFAQWAAIYGEAGSTTSNPAFLNSGGSYALSTDFKIQPSSPFAVKAGGATGTGVTTDYGARTRKTSPGPSMGAWELLATEGAIGGGSLRMDMGVNGQIAPYLLNGR